MRRVGQIITMVFFGVVMAGCSGSRGPAGTRLDEDILREEFNTFAEEIAGKSLDMSDWDKTSDGYQQVLSELQADYAQFEEIQVIVYEETSLELGVDTARLSNQAELRKREYGKPDFVSSGKADWTLSYRKVDGAWLIAGNQFPNGDSSTTEADSTEDDEKALRDIFETFADEIEGKSLRMSNWDKSSSGYQRERDQLKGDYATYEKIKISLGKERYLSIDGDKAELTMGAKFAARKYGETTYDDSGKGNWTLTYRKIDGEWLIINSVWQ